MAKLINILAASVGGGIMLGAGIRLGEAIVGRDEQGESRLVERLGALEDRLGNLETGNTSHIRPANEKAKDSGKQAAAAAAVRTELARDQQRVAALNEIAVQLRTEMRGWLEESVGARMAEAETKLKAEADLGREQLLDAFAESVQTRVMQRISRLEDEVAGQSAAMNELRDCSLRTEQSLQKLLGGLDRILVQRSDPPRAESEAVRNEAVAESLPETSSLAEIEPKPRRWSLFG